MKDLRIADMFFYTGVGLLIGGIHGYTSSEDSNYDSMLLYAPVAFVAGYIVSKQPAGDIKYKDHSEIKEGDCLIELSKGRPKYKKRKHTTNSIDFAGSYIIGRYVGQGMRMFPQ